MTNLVKKVHQVSFHRNGIGGAGFHAILFDASLDTGTHLMVATVFDQPGHVAVLQVKPLSTDVGVKFGANSWRGDCFERELRDAIETHQSVGSTRVGPFAIPTTIDTRELAGREQ